MKIGVIGSRSYDDYEELKKVLDSFDNITLIISGGANGADKLGEKYADDNNIEKLIHYPDWDEHGKMAGFVRNTDIVNDSDMVVAFWDGKSRGTKDSITKAFKGHTPILTIHFKPIDYGEWWNSFKDHNERVDFIESKWKEYRDMGYEVSHFRSASSIGWASGHHITNKGLYHELMTIHTMDKWIKNQKNE